MNHAARIFVLAGPSGVGKGTVIRHMLSLNPDIFLSVSVTTRAPRPGEIDGKHYIFTSEEEFTKLIEEGQMLEWALVHGQARYGTPRKPIEEAVACGKTVLLEVDLAGARQIKEKLPNAHYIFLLPPSWQVLEERLRGRHSETEEQIAARLATAKVELAAASEFDYQVVNDDVARATSQILHIMGIDG